MKHKLLKIFGVLIILAVFICCELPLEFELVAYGTIQSDGTIVESSDNFTVEHTATGTYTITWEGSLRINVYQHIINAEPLATSDRYISVMSYSNGEFIIIRIFNNTGSYQNCDFCFSANKI